jgi:hypothetical protein
MATSSLPKILNDLRPKAEQQLRADLALQIPAQRPILGVESP